MAIIERTDVEREVQLMRDLMEAQNAHHELFPDASELALGEDCMTTVLTVDYFERICEAEDRLERLTRELEEVRTRLYANHAGGVVR
jgi:hypothetical protein